MNPFRRSSPTFLATLLTAVLALLGQPSLSAAGLEEATVTRAFNIVDLLDRAGGEKPAEIGEKVSGSRAVRTGNRSRAELTFNDDSIARLGGNTIFSFDRGTRGMNLDNGVILLQVPKDAGGAEIRTAAVTAAVTGTTVFIEFIAGNIMKFIVVEGLLRLTMTGEIGESILLEAGQMITIPTNADRFPEPVFVDLAKLVSSSGLMSDQFPPLGNQQQMLAAIREQQQNMRSGQLLELNYAVQGEPNIPSLSIADLSSQLTRTQSTVEAGPNPGAPQTPVQPPPATQPPPPPPRIQQQQQPVPQVVREPRPKPKKQKMKKPEPPPPPPPPPPPRKKKKEPEYPEYPED